MPNNGDILISRHDTHVGDDPRKSLNTQSHYPQMGVVVLEVLDAG